MFGMCNSLKSRVYHEHCAMKVRFRYYVYVSLYIKAPGDNKDTVYENNNIIYTTSSHTHSAQQVPLYTFLFLSLSTLQKKS